MGLGALEAGPSIHVVGNVFCCSGGHIPAAICSLWQVGYRYRPQNADSCRNVTATRAIAVVGRLGARGMAPPTPVRMCAVTIGSFVSRVVGWERVGRRLGGAYAPLYTSLETPSLRSCSRGATRRPRTRPAWDDPWRYMYISRSPAARSGCTLG